MQTTFFFSICGLAASLMLWPGCALACWQEAASRQGVPAALLYAIAQAESSLNPVAVNRTHYERTGTVDIGYMGINSDRRVLHRLGVTEQALYEPCTNIQVGSRILAEKIRRYGNTWEAVGAYNASCAKLDAVRCQAARRRYAWRVYRFMAHVRPAAPPALAAAAEAIAPRASILARVSLR